MSRKNLTLDVWRKNCPDRITQGEVVAIKYLFRNKLVRGYKYGERFEITCFRDYNYVISMKVDFNFK